MSETVDQKGCSLLGDVQDFKRRQQDDCFALYVSVLCSRHRQKIDKFRAQDIEKNRHPPPFLLDPSFCKNSQICLFANFWRPYHLLNKVSPLSLSL